VNGIFVLGCGFIFVVKTTRSIFLAFYNLQFLGVHLSSARQDDCLAQVGRGGESACRVSYC
jgi:hypothetical protein